MRCFLCLDVGGTQIKSALLAQDGSLCGAVRHNAALADQDRETILSNFVQIVVEGFSAAQRQGLTPSALRLAFPGPFDYAGGVCLIEGLGKYAALYGTNMRKELSARLQPYGGALASAAGDIRFINDASAFALGEMNFGCAQNAARALFVCIGTGCGSAFGAAGTLAEETMPGVPAGGVIYPTPFYQSCVDDYISRRGLERLSQKHLGKPLDGKALADLAHQGDARARAVFAEFGDLLVEALLPFLQNFAPETLCLGGQIMASEALFLPALRRVCQTLGIPVYLTENTSLRAMQGLLLL